MYITNIYTNTVLNFTQTGIVTMIYTLNNIYSLCNCSTVCGPSVNHRFYIKSASSLKVIIVYTIVKYILFEVCTCTVYSQSF